jgi:hypothetical protein
MRDGVAEAWKLLKGGLKKEPGLGLIEVKGTVEKLAMVDFSYTLNYSRIEEIMDMLKTLSWTAFEVQSQSFSSVL